MKPLAVILVLALWTGVSYIACRETVRYEIAGTVVENQSFVEKDGNGYVKDSMIRIEQADGSVVKLANEDDLLCTKTNSDQIEKICEAGKLVRVRVNGFGNILAVKRFDKIEDSPATTNKVEATTK